LFTWARDRCHILNDGGSIKDISSVAEKFLDFSAIDILIIDDTGDKIRNPDQLYIIDSFDKSQRSDRNLLDALKWLKLFDDDNREEYDLIHAMDDLSFRHTF